MKGGIRKNEKMFTHRGIVTASRGAIATSHPLASSAGLWVLREGGNFIDAGVAAAAVLNVVEPGNSHLGGDVFMLVYTRKEGQVTAINGSGAAPRLATPDRFPQGIPTRHISACTVPGEVDGWITALEKFGTWPLARVLEPAIYYAEEGFPVNPRLAQSLANNGHLFADRSDWLKVFWPQGYPPQVGEVLRQPDLARTLRKIAEGGREAFYLGEIAECISQTAEEQGGLLRKEDLTEHRTEVKAPLSTTYRGYQVFEQPPVSQGIILLEELNILENFDLPEVGPLSADGVHWMVEAKKLAFADRLAYLGDPQWVDIPLEELLSKEWAQQRAQLISKDRANPSPLPGKLKDTDTTYLCVVDSEGNAVSFIQSIFHHFGSGVVVPGTGIILNNRLTGFSLDPHSPNFLQPRKRPIHTLNTYMVFNSSPFRLYLVGGTPGGDVQVQTNLQVLSCLLDGGMNVQESAEAPKWSHNQSNNILTLEGRFSGKINKDLSERGHTIHLVGPWDHGSAVQIIMAHPESGAYLCGSDPRCDGCAMGY